MSTRRPARVLVRALAVIAWAVAGVALASSDFSESKLYDFFPRLEWYGAIAN